MKLSAILSALIGLHALMPRATAAEIYGQVLDVQGKGIPGAAVIIQQDGRMEAVSIQSAEDGTFNVPALTPGRYLIRVQKSGFLEQRQGPLEVMANGANVEVKVRLAPSAEP